MIEPRNLPTRVAVAGAALALTLGGCSTNKVVATPIPALGPVLRQPGTGTVPALTVTSATFANGAAMPTSVALAGCGGGNVSPQLSWTAGPAATQSYLVTEFDADAPTGVGFWHWLVFDIPASVTSFDAGAGSTATGGIMSGITDYGTQFYGGPCPPTGDGPHHYTFTVSALDIPTLSGVSGPTATGAFLTFNARGHIIAQGTLVGTYAR